MPPDFSKPTIETLAKRSAFRCSNPDCRTLTVGPNSDDNKASTIGEAAHIYGARPNSKRYQELMTVKARAEITNAIWLCRNCHAKVDRDEQYYSAELLFKWREIHEHYVACEFGSNSDKMRLEIEEYELRQFQDYPAIIRRIAIDKPAGWEWRLTAELMRHLNEPELQRLSDLKKGLYVKPLDHVRDSSVLRWIGNITAEIGVCIAPLEPLLESLREAWGAQGEPGKLEQIHRTCLYIRDYIKRIIDLEERLYFVHVPDEFKSLIALIRGAFGDNLDQFREIPTTLDEVVALVDTDHEGTEENPLVIRKTISFSLPDGWLESVESEMKTSTNKYILRRQVEQIEDSFEGD